MFQYYAELIRVIDGSTLELLIDLGFKVKIKARVKVLHLESPSIKNSNCKAEYIHATEAKIKAEQILKEKRLMIASQDGYKNYYVNICIADTLLDFAQTMKEAGFQKRKSYE